MLGILFNLWLYSLETESFTDPETRLITSPSNCAISGPNNTGITSMCEQPYPTLYMGAGDLNSGIHVCTANALTYRWRMIFCSRSFRPK